MRNSLRILALALLLCCLMGSSARAASAVNLTFHTEEGESETVALVTPGIVFTAVKSDGQEITVLTSDLEWETTAEAGKRIAYISAPNTGRSQVVRRPSSSAKSMGRLATGKIVLVLTAPSGKYTGINYYGQTGYVLTATLAYPDTSRGVQTGKVASKDGSTNGRQTINLRMKPNRSSRKIATVKTGAAATVYRVENGWAEVDVGGWHGYLMEEYLLLDGTGVTFVSGDRVTEDSEPAAEEAPQATETPAPGAVNDHVDVVEEIELPGD